MLDEEAKQIVKAASNVLMEAVLDIIQSDPHQWSKRPCISCGTISSIIGQPFGCDKYREERS